MEEEEQTTPPCGHLFVPVAPQLSLVPLPYSTGGGVRTPDPLPRARAEGLLYGGQGDIARWECRVKLIYCNYNPLVKRMM